MWDKIAKIGSFTDMNGVERRLTRALFKELVANYKQATEKAPVVFGHPATAAPAQGWVAELRVNGDYLEARYEQIKPEARAKLAAKSYRYKSMSYDSATNTLKHVGFLGAAAPAISGLGEIVYLSAATPSELSFLAPTGRGQDKQQTSEGTSRLNAEGAYRSVAQPPRIKRLVRSSAQDAPTEGIMTEEELREKEALIKELEAQIAVLRQELADAEAETEATQAEFAKYRANIVETNRSRRVDALVASGKLAPSERGKVLQMATSLGASAASFAAADGKISVEEQYLRDLEGRDAHGLFAEFSKPRSTQAEVSGSKMISKL